MSSPFDEVMQRALDATQRDALDESEALIQQAIAMNAGAAFPFYLRATNLAHAGNYELAEAAYMATLTRAPDFFIARFQLGLLQITSGRPAIAHASWEPLLVLADDHPLKLFVLGFLAILREDWAQARDSFRRGVALNHENAPLNADMQGVIARVGAAEAMAREAAQASADQAPEVAADNAHFLIGAYRQP